VFEWLTDAASGNPISYLVVLLASGGDVLFPPVPSETLVISAGVVAAKGGLSPWIILPAAALGAFVGDNASYWLGRSAGDPLARRLFRGERGERRLAWAQRAVGRHGGVLILMGRFIPGGRTASTFAAGTLELPYARFLVADAFAALAWAVYATLLGYLGGETFSDSAWKPFVAALAVAGLITLAFEGWRRAQRRCGKDILGDPL